MSEIDIKLVARRLSRPLMVVGTLLLINFILWLLRSMFTLLSWMPVAGIFSVFSLPIVIEGAIQIVMIFAIFQLVNGVQRLSKIFLIINFLFISLIYLGVALVVGYWTSGLSAYYSEQLISGAQRGWLITLVIILSALSLGFIGFVCRKWLLHAAATKIVFAAS